MSKRNTTSLLRYFSKQIIIRRNEQKISQMQLAEMIDCHLNTINNIETCRHDPTFEMALKISKALKISLDAMVDLVLEEINI